MMRKFLTLLVLIAVATPLFLVQTPSARAEDLPTSIEAKNKPKPKPEPTPTPPPKPAPKPKPGPREGGADG